MTLTLAPLQPTVTAGQVETITWSRDSTAPMRFVFAKSTQGSVVPIMPTISVNKAQSQGTFTVTFVKPGTQVHIVAYDLEKDVLPLLPEIFPAPDQSPPFFVDPQVIAIVSPVQTATTATSTAVSSNVVTGTTEGSTGSPSLTTNGNPTVTSSGASGVMSTSVTTRTVAGGTPVGPSSTLQISSIKPTVPGTLTGGHSTSGVASTPTDSSTSTSGATQPSRKPNVHVIVGSIVGSLVGLAVVVIILFLKQRTRRHKNTSSLTPFSTTSPISGTTNLEIHNNQEKEAIIEQNSYLECQLDTYDIVSQGSHTRDEIINDTNGPNEGGDIVQSLQRHVDVLNQRIATLEAELAPPDYSSRAGTT